MSDAYAVAHTLLALPTSIREIELAQALANATAAGQDASSNKDKSGGGGGGTDDATLATLEGLLSGAGSEGDAAGN